MATRLPVAPAADPALRHAMGQHFLRAPRIIDTIVNAAQIGPGDRIWEIGCGDGALTGPLWDKQRRLTIIELDPTLAAAALAQWPQIHLERGDAVQLLPQMAQRLTTDMLPTVVVSNLPYSAATAILRAFFLPAYCETRLVLMFQREVALRILGRTPSDRGPLAGMAPLLYEIRSVVRVAPGAFNPPPKVESEVLAFTPRSDPVAQQVRQQADAYWAFLTRAFAARRKTLRNNLPQLRVLADLEEVSGLRPERLSPPQLWALYQRLVVAS